MGWGCFGSILGILSLDSGHFLAPGAGFGPICRLLGLDLGHIWLIWGLWGLDLGLFGGLDGPILSTSGFRLFWVFWAWFGVNLRLLLMIECDKEDYECSLTWLGTHMQFWKFLKCDCRLWICWFEGNNNFIHWIVIWIPFFRQILFFSGLQLNKNKKYYKSIIQ